MDYIHVEFKLPDKKLTAALEELLKKEGFAKYVEGNWLHLYDDELFDKLGPQLDEILEASGANITGGDKEYLMLYISAFAEGWSRSGDDWCEIEVLDEEEGEGEGKGEGHEGGCGCKDCK